MLTRAGEDEADAVDTMSDDVPHMFQQAGDGSSAYMYTAGVVAPHVDFVGALRSDKFHDVMHFLVSCFRGSCSCRSHSWSPNLYCITVLLIAGHDVYEDAADAAPASLRNKRTHDDNDVVTRRCAGRIALADASVEPAAPTRAAFKTHGAPGCSGAAVMRVEPAGKLRFYKCK